MLSLEKKLKCSTCLDRHAFYSDFTCATVTQYYQRSHLAGPSNLQARKDYKPWRIFIGLNFQAEYINPLLKKFGSR